MLAAAALDDRARDRVQHADIILLVLPGVSRDQKHAAVQLGPRSPTANPAAPPRSAAQSAVQQKQTDFRQMLGQLGQQQPLLSPRERVGRTCITQFQQRDKRGRFQPRQTLLIAPLACCQVQDTTHQR